MAEWRDPEVLASVKALGQRIRWIREQLQLRQDEMADLCGVSKSTVLEVEQGKPKDVAYLIVISRGVKCPFHKLWWPSERWERFVAENLEKFTARRDALARARAKAEKDRLS